MYVYIYIYIYIVRRCPAVRSSIEAAAIGRLAQMRIGRTSINRSYGRIYFVYSDTTNTIYIYIYRERDRDIISRWKL